MRLLCTAAVAASLFLSPTPAAAQRAEATSSRLRTQSITLPTFEPASVSAGGFRSFAATLEQRPPAATPSRSRSLRRTVLGAIVGAAGGFFAGGFTGAWIEGDRCDCDDPGFKGFLIGAPVGTIVGGIVGGLYLF